VAGPRRRQAPTAPDQPHPRGRGREARVLPLPRALARARDEVDHGFIAAGSVTTLPEPSCGRERPIPCAHTPEDSISCRPCRHMSEPSPSRPCSIAPRGARGCERPCPRPAWRRHPAMESYHKVVRLTRCSAAAPYRQYSPIASSSAHTRSGSCHSSRSPFTRRHTARVCAL